MAALRPSKNSLGENPVPSRVSTEREARTDSLETRLGVDQEI